MQNHADASLDEGYNTLTCQCSSSHELLHSYNSHFVSSLLSE